MYTRSKKISPKNKKDLGMACHTPPLKKAKKQGEMPLPHEKVQKVMNVTLCIVVSWGDTHNNMTVLFYPQKF